MSILSKCQMMMGVGLLAGCSPAHDPPLFFAQAQTFGVGIHGSTVQQSADLTLGYRGVDVALVPVTVTNAAGDVVPLTGYAGGGRSGNALSVLGQFNANATGTATADARVNLGTFFATGLAADKLADGFSAQIAK